MTTKDHNKLVGTFLMIHGGIQALMMLLVSLIYGGIGLAILLGGKNGDKPVGIFFIIAIAFVAIISSLFVIPQLVGGWKMFKEKPNAKIWGIAGSIISCLSFPLGTAAGVYGLWFLFGEEGKRFYDNPENLNHLNEMNQVSEFKTQDFYKQREPHSWK